MCMLCYDGAHLHGYRELNYTVEKIACWQAGYQCLTLSVCTLLLLFEGTFQPAFLANSAGMWGLVYSCAFTPVSSPTVVQINVIMSSIKGSLLTLTTRCIVLQRCLCLRIRHAFKCYQEYKMLLFSGHVQKKCFVFIYWLIPTKCTLHICQAAFVIRHSTL